MDSADDSSRRLAFELHLEDVQELRSDQTGNPRKRKAADFEFALDVYRGDLEDALQSIYEEELGLAAPLRATVAAVSTLRPIKRPALVLSTTKAPDKGNFGASRDAEASRVVASVAMPSLAAHGKEQNNAATDGGAALTEHSKSLRCISCGDAHSNESAARAPCDHHWCAGCLRRFFTRATVNEGIFPPQCCTQPIPLTEVSKWLPAELVTEFEKKQVEFTTPNRVYCASKRCAAFIPPDKIAVDRATCNDCGRLTCTICKAKGHKGICARDPAKRRTMALAKRQKWQKCYSCKTVVELDSGCNHITCRCGAQFCYICGKKWNSCRCPIWTEARIILE